MRSKLTVLSVLFASTLLQGQGTLAVVNGASFQGRFPVSPGSLASVFGTFTGVASAQAQALPLPRELGGVRVRVGGADAPLVAVTAGQINFQVPRSTAQGRQTVQVIAGGNTLAQGFVDVLEVGPGIFLLDSAPTPQGAILNQNSTVNSQTARASRGQVIQIFATGEGPVTAPPEDGQRPSGLTTTTKIPKAYVSVFEAVVEFSGLSPEFPGLWQLNIRLPDRPVIAGRVPLVVTLDGIESNTVSLWVAE